MGYYQKARKLGLTPSNGRDCVVAARNSPIGQWVETVGGATLPGSTLSPVVGGTEAVGGIVEMAPDLKRNRDTIDALLEGDLDKASELQCEN